jgi:hypothetical protein
VQATATARAATGSTTTTAHTDPFALASFRGMYLDGKWLILLYVMKILLGHFFSSQIQ